MASEVSRPTMSLHRTPLVLRARAGGAAPPPYLSLRGARPDVFRSAEVESDSP